MEPLMRGNLKDLNLDAMNKNGKNGEDLSDDEEFDGALGKQMTGACPFIPKKKA